MIAVALWLALRTAAAPVPAATLGWPPPPDRPRILHAGLIPDPATLAVAPSRGSWFTRGFKYLVGLSDDPAAAAGSLNRPTGLSVRGGAVYIADPGHHKIVRRDLVTGEETPLPHGRDGFNAPTGVAAAPDGRVFVADGGAGRVVMIDAKGGVDREIKAPGGFLRPTGIAIDAKRDRLYVADTGRHVVQIFESGGKHLRTLGGRGSGQGEFNFPTYLWVAERDGSLLVCDSMNFRIQTFNAAGAWTSAFGEYGDRPGYLARPRGVCTDADGNIYVVDGAMEAVQVFDRAGRLLLFFGQSGTGPGGFALPGGIATADGETLYVADTYNARLQAFKYLREGVAQ